METQLLHAHASVGMAPSSLRWRLSRAPAMPLVRKHYRQFQQSRLMLHFDLAPFLALGEAVLHLALDVKILDIATLFRLPERDQYIPAVPLLVATLMTPAAVFPIKAFTPAWITCTSRTTVSGSR